jgi:calcineurin-like phosphoesterase family protein
MDKTIVQNINSKVQPEDELFILGDLMFGDKERGINLVRQLNGHKTLIIGNHDNFTDEQYQAMGLEEWCYYMVSSGNAKHPPVVMAHDPVETVYLNRVWSFDNTEPILLNGHVHDSAEYYVDKVSGAISINVGVDVWGMQPVTLKQIRKRRQRILKELKQGGQYESN